MNTTKIGNITEKAMLVTLNISRWQARKSDKVLSQEIADNHHNQRDMIDTRKRLLAKNALEELNQIASRARVLHYELTLPWNDDNQRILAATAFFKYQETMEDLKNEWVPAVRKFIYNYPDYVKQAQIDLNGLFNQADYPDAAEIPHKFKLNYTVYPMPDAQDFRVKLNGEEVSRIKQEMEASVNAQLQNATRDIYNRMIAVVTKLRNKLNECSKSDDEAKTIFRDSLVNNIIDVLDMIPLINVLEDQNIIDFADKIRRELTLYEPDQLRSSVVARQSTSEAADEILKKMQEYI